MPGETYAWKRFWCPRNGSLNLQDGGYLVDPYGVLGRRWNAELRPFDSIADLPRLVMFGEPGMGKTSTMRSERRAIDTGVRAGGGETGCPRSTRKRQCFAGEARVPPDPPRGPFTAT